MKLFGCVAAIGRVAATKWEWFAEAAGNDLRRARHKTVSAVAALGRATSRTVAALGRAASWTATRVEVAVRVSAFTALTVAILIVSSALTITDRSAAVSVMEERNRERNRFLVAYDLRHGAPLLEYLGSWAVVVCPKEV